MSNDDIFSGNAEEEIAFWRDFIEWWETKEGRPATPRMREALAYAEAKSTVYGEGKPCDDTQSPTWH